MSSKESCNQKRESMLETCIQGMVNMLVICILEKENNMETFS